MIEFVAITAMVIITIIAFYKIIAIVLNRLNEELDGQKTKRHYDEMENMFYDYHHKQWIWKSGFPKLEKEAE
jgi:heme/copper-type cytochrome/quinol oxidase subunit 2